LAKFYLANLQNFRKIYFWVFSLSKQTVSCEAIEWKKETANAGDLICKFIGIIEIIALEHVKSTLTELF